MQSVLLVDDNEEILSTNHAHLAEHGFFVTCANTGVKAISLLNTNRYDCIVLDILLPDLDGYAICKAARTITDTPIIFLSCLDEPNDKVKGLSVGGDDFVSKPYSLKELTARIVAIIRRNEHVEAYKGDFWIDSDNKMIRISGKNILLSEKEFALFLLFYENPDTVFSKEMILDKIWHNSAEVGIVAVRISRLRRKLEFAEGVLGRIESRYGTGYCFTTAEVNE